MGDAVGGPVGGVVGGLGRGVGDAVSGVTGGLGDGVEKIGQGDLLGGVGSVVGGVTQGVGGLREACLVGSVVISAVDVGLGFRIMWWAVGSRAQGHMELDVETQNTTLFV